MSLEWTRSVGPERLVTPAGVLPLPRSLATRLGTTAHGVALTIALPVATRMLVVHEGAASTEAAYYRHVLLTATNPNRRRQKTLTNRQHDQHADHGTENALRHC
jgi:hypothetical protein